MAEAKIRLDHLKMRIGIIYYCLLQDYYIWYILPKDSVENPMGV
jgi:hypothetical protein